MNQKLRIALWLGERLPFEWAPRWLNNRLAAWMWHVPGFNDYEMGSAWPSPDTRKP